MSNQNFITPGHVRAYQMITSQLYDNVTLTSVYINGDPGVAIVLVDHVGENKVAVMPLFVAITASMKLEFPGEERQGSGDDEGGGPKRYDALRQYETKSEPGGSN
jgi:hypothetical protein